MILPPVYNRLVFKKWEFVMEIISQVVNGTEDLNQLQSNEIKALALFYKAFNQRDIELMQKSWLTSDEISMDNPVGGMKRGWNEIKSVYEKIFYGKAKVYVEFYDYTIHSTADMFFVTGRERGYFKTENDSIELAIRTSRIFVKKKDQWKQIHHHGSIDNPELLMKYQNLVK